MGRGLGLEYTCMTGLSEGSENGASEVDHYLMGNGGIAQYSGEDVVHGRKRRQIC